MNQPASVSRSPSACRELSISTGQHGGTSEHNIHIMERESASSSGLSSTVDSVAPSAVYRYAKHLKSKYKGVAISCDGKYPPTPSKKYVNLVVVRHKPRDLDEVMKYTLHGNIKEMLEDKEQISIEDILKPNKDQKALKLAVIEGPPGIGKSTVAWELCSRWDEIPSMSRYDLVVLLRLRERSVQQIQNLSGLFPHHDSELRQSVAKEVLENEGDRVLFVLDGFDELPVNHRQSGLLIDLIKGEVLPKCSVLVTSRPSATADLLTSCRPRVEKHVEILGFTEEYVKEYASSVFSSEPEVLKDFLTYISASTNPVINSLMYVPLNAAIIVEIYRNSKKADRPIPKTLTQLYTQLCLTLIQRDLNNRDPSKRYNFHDFAALPKNHHADLLKLAKIAFDGFKEEKVIFYTDMVSEDLVHFGLLDTVSSFCGGGDSHNFLHLTLQEFLVAYHISQLDDLEVFKQYGSDERWNVVWRFIAGLTGFEYFKAVMTCGAFVWTSRNKVPSLSSLFIQSLFEAQMTFDYKASFNTERISAQFERYHAPLDHYALGYCIASSAPTATWDVELSTNKFSRCADAFIWGLKSKEYCGSIIVNLNVNDLCLDAFKQCPSRILQNITSFSLTIFSDAIESLPEIIPLMIKLNDLSISCRTDSIMEIMNVVSCSNVTSLNIREVSLSTLRSSVFLTALTKLIDPSNGKLKIFHVKLRQETLSDQSTPELCALIFASSSLQDLHVSLYSIGSLDLLETNTSLSSVTIEWVERPCVESLVSVLRHNKTLQNLTLLPSFSYCDSDIKFLEIIINACQENYTLRELILRMETGADDWDTDMTLQEIIQYMQQHYPFDSDPRICLLAIINYQ